MARKLLITQYRLIIGLIVSLICCQLTFASEDNEIRVIALFKNAAMVEYGGKQKMYRVGQKIAPHIKLVKSDPHSAIFDINGKQQELTLKQGSFAASYSEDKNVETSPSKVAKILRNNHGMYQTVGFINGVSVQFLVDTGASQVAMNERVAKQVGLLYKLQGEPVSVSTAAGVVPAWRATLKTVRVGGIELHNVEALVVKGVGPGEVLLGMSFLNRVKMEDNGQIMQLIKKY